MKTTLFLLTLFFSQLVVAKTIDVVFLPQIHEMSGAQFDRRIVFTPDSYGLYMYSQLQIFNYLSSHKHERQVVFLEDQTRDMTAATMFIKALPGVSCHHISNIFFGVPEPLTLSSLSVDQQRVLYYLGGAKLALCLGYVASMPKAESEVAIIKGILKSWWLLLRAEFTGGSYAVTLKNLAAEKSDEHIFLGREKYALGAIARYMSAKDTPPNTKPILVYGAGHDFRTSKASFALNLSPPTGYCEDLASAEKTYKSLK